MAARGLGLALVLAAIALASWLLAPSPVPAPGAIPVWLPYPAGIEAWCLQGPHSLPTHDGWSWDFALPEGVPVLAALPGRVIWVIDDRSATGFNDTDQANHVFVDLGEGRFATYSHHRQGSARVVPGELVAVGTHLADVGATGTTSPHIHFDVRGPSWHQTHPLGFRGPGPEPVAVHRKGTYRSATAPGASPAAGFRDSTLAGDEFAANGVALAPGPPAFRLRAGEQVAWSGRVLVPADEVRFHLWPMGRPTEYSASAPVGADGRFTLVLEIPVTCRGPRWYRVTPAGPGGSYSDQATLPARVE